MYPQAELTALAQCKRDLMRKIGVQREGVVVLVDHALRPIRCVNVVYATWLQIKDMAEPLGHALNQTFAAKSAAEISGVFRWAPLALNLFRAMR